MTKQPGLSEVGPVDRLAESRKSEYWDKPLPGVGGWTVGMMIEKLVDFGLFTDGDTPENLYNRFQEDEKKSKEEGAN